MADGDETLIPKRAAAIRMMTPLRRGKRRILQFEHHALIVPVPLVIPVPTFRLASIVATAPWSRSFEI
jgi:hypothetical protein